MSAAQGRIATASIFFVNGLGIGAWAVNIPLFKARLGLSDAALSLVLLAFAAGAVLSMPVAGLLAPRLGSGRAVLLSGLLFAAALLLPTLAGTLAWLIAASMAVGIANGAMDVSMNAHATSVEQRYGAAIMSSFHAAFSAGGLAGAGLGAAFVIGGASVAGVLPLAACVAAAAIIAGWSSIGHGEAAPGGAGLALPARAALPLCAAALCCMMCEGAMTDWSAVTLAAITDARPAVAAAGYAAFSACMVFGRLTGDRIVRGIGRVRTVRFGGALAAVGLALAAVAPVPWVGIGGFAMVGLGLSNVVPAIFSAAGALGVSAGLGIAMAATAGYAGFLIGPPMIGGIATLSSLRIGMAVLAIAAGCVALLAGSLRTRSTAAARLVSSRPAPYP